MIGRKPKYSSSLLSVLILLFLPGSPLCEDRFESLLEDSLLVLTNAERLKHKLPSLEKDYPVARVARGHSLDMLRRGFFGHVNPDGLNVHERLNLANIWYASCAENVGKTLTVANAHRGFMESEAHRKNILTREYTHMGIGILKGEDGLLYVTENFIETIDTVDVDSTAALIETTLNRRRTHRKYSFLRRDSSIDSLAATHSLKMLLNEKPNIPQDFGNIRSRARAFHYVTPWLDKVFKDKDLIHCPGSRIGIGMAQGNSRKYGNGLLWITIVIVE
jgi:uncharacterized protein YkwD